jgi:hypothetical protein
MGQARRQFLHPIFRPLTHARSSEVLKGWAIHPGAWSKTPAVEFPHRPRGGVLPVRKLIEGGKFRPIDELKLQPHHTTVYLCGHPQMIENAKGILRRRGLTKEFIRGEVYWAPQREASWVPTLPSRSVSPT